MLTFNLVDPLLEVLFSWLDSFGIDIATSLPFALEQSTVNHLFVGEEE